MGLERYRPSGRFGIGVPLFAVVGAIPALLAGGVYSAITVFVPIIGVITVLACIGLGFVLLAYVAGGLRAGHNRNVVVGHLVGLWMGAVTLYSAWGFFFLFLAQQAGEPIEWFVAFDPLFMATAIPAIGADGWYEVGGMSPSGLVLYGFWAAEASIFLLGGLAGGGAGTPYCEACGQWADDEATLILADAVQGERLSTLATQWDVEQLVRIPNVQEAPPGTTVFALQHTQCVGCGTFATVSVQQIRVSVDKNGQIEKTTTTELRPHVVAAADVDMLAALRAEAAAAPEPSDGPPVPPPTEV